MLKKSSNIFVTGHKGLVGSAVVRRLHFFGYSNNSCDDIKLKTVINFANLDAIFHSNRSTLNLLIFIRSVIIIFIASVFLKLYIQFYTLFSKIYLKVNLRKERNMLLFFIPFILLNLFFIFI
jgi:nucleoside-diphosphate-sugar epimerase